MSESTQQAFEVQALSDNCGVNGAVPSAGGSFRAAAPNPHDRLRVVSLWYTMVPSVAVMADRVPANFGARQAGLALVLGPVLLGFGCGGGPVPNSTLLGQDAAARGARWVGRAFFEARHATPTGVSLTVQRMPMSGTVVELLASDRSLVDTTATDAQGRFTFETRSRGALVSFVSRSSGRVPELAVTSDAEGRHPYRWDVPLGAAQEGPVVARDTPGSLAGAFHVLETLRRGRASFEAWTGRHLPPLFVHWAPGQTDRWSYYHGATSDGSGRYAIELMAPSGQTAGQPQQDTDEHDESIILHEMGHFVMELISSDSSAGGQHPPGTLVEPGLAFEEGRATWFSAAVLGHPWYLDAVGREPLGSLRVSHNLERGQAGPRGLGSEQEVAELLWDLSDGPEGVPDEDEDGVSLGPSGVLAAMAELRSQEGLYPAMSTFLQHLVRVGRVSEPALRELLYRGGYPSEFLDRSWPPILRMGETGSGHIDGRSPTAPSGGPNRPDTGIDAVQVYRIPISVEGELVLRLRILGSGRASRAEDLDLELRSTRAELLARSASERQEEVIHYRATPGWLVAYVRDGGTGNRVGFELSATLIR